MPPVATTGLHKGSILCCRAWLRWTFRAARDASLARLDEAGFVGEHDSLDTISQVELAEDVGEVRLDGRFG